MMDDTYYFVLQKNVQENVTAAAELSEALSNVGITCEIVENTVLKIQVNADQFQNVTRRNAGKKKKITAFSGVMPEDFLAEYNEKGIDYIAEKYKISRRTAYRRIAQAKEHPGDTYWYRYDENGKLR